jgi:hypothetical protein
MTTATTKKRLTKPRTPVRSLTVSELVSAARQLEDDQWLRLMTALDRIEDQRFRKERDRAAKRPDGSVITDDEIDEIVVRQRRESRG